MDNTVELYHEFLNLMESTNYHDDLIPITSEKATLPYTNLPLNLNLHLNINSYYDMLTGTGECTFDSKLYNIPKSYDECPGLQLHVDKDRIYTGIEFDVEEQEEELLSDTEYDNPVVPGLFPAMNVDDERQFIKFDKLPIVPSYISK